MPVDFSAAPQFFCSRERQCYSWKKLVCTTPASLESLTWNSGENISGIGFIQTFNAHCFCWSTKTLFYPVMITNKGRCVLTSHWPSTCAFPCLGSTGFVFHYSQFQLALPPWELLSCIKPALRGLILTWKGLNSSLQKSQMIPTIQTQRRAPLHFSTESFVNVPRTETCSNWTGLLLHFIWKILANKSHTPPSITSQIWFSYDKMGIFKSHMITWESV